jgi:hypothetical protein
MRTLAILLLIFGTFLIYKTLQDKYTQKTQIIYQNLKQPIKLYWKEKATFWHTVIIQDQNGKLERFGSMSLIANHIGDNYNIGDTIKSIR